LLFNHKVALKLIISDMEATDLSKEKFPYVILGSGLTETVIAAYFL